MPNCCNDAFYAENKCECGNLFGAISANAEGFPYDPIPCDDEDGLGGGLGGGGTRTLKFRYVYQYLDHLGNVRLSYSDLDKSGDIDKATEIIEEHNYYPFGLKHKGYNQIVNTDNEHKFHFNDTEFDDDFDLNWYNMPLRHQDPTTGRWNGIDPVTHFSSSTYAGYNNNPVFWADPSGADWKSFWSGVKTFFGASSSGMPKGYGKVGGSEGSSVGGFVVNRVLGWAKNQVLKEMFNGENNAANISVGIQNNGNNGSGAWVSTRDWEHSDIKGFSDFVMDASEKILAQTEEDGLFICDCADLAMVYLTMYAFNNKLPISFTLASGKELSNTSTSYTVGNKNYGDINNPLDFIKIIRKYGSAKSILNDMNPLGDRLPVPGDLYNSGSHVRVLLNIDNGVLNHIAGSLTFDDKGVHPFHGDTFLDRTGTPNGYRFKVLDIPTPSRPKLYDQPIKILILKH